MTSLRAEIDAASFTESGWAGGEGMVFWSLAFLTQARWTKHNMKKQKTSLIRMDYLWKCKIQNFLTKH